MMRASSRAPNRTESRRYSRTIVAAASIASITSSSERASAWMSSRSSGVTNVRLRRWMTSCVRKSHLCSTSLISSALSHSGRSGASIASSSAAPLRSSSASASKSVKNFSSRGIRRNAMNRRILADPLGALEPPPPVYSGRASMPTNNEVLAIILGGGQGTRLFPLTQHRSKPAVPIGGSYRLIDIPISNCLHADIRRIFVLTQFNSASLNRHISQAYRMDPCSQGFVDILAAEQTPDNPNWYQGTADAVRQAARHFVRYDADYYLILAGDHLYRMDYSAMVDAHCDSRADITVAAQPVS